MILKVTILLLVMVMFIGCSDHGESNGLTNPTDPNGPVSFAADVQPIFETNCVFCHGVGGNAGLDLRQGLSYGNIVGKAANNSIGNLIVAGDVSSSVLFQRMTAAGNAMPPVGSLPTAIVSIVEQWITEGALDN